MYSVKERSHSVKNVNVLNRIGMVHNEKFTDCRRMLAANGPGTALQYSTFYSSPVPEPPIVFNIL